jgi:hypothetical protein
MAMTENEISALIGKLRERYADYAEKYSPRWFDLEAFEGRYAVALKKRMNLEGFILAEIANFEKVRESYTKKRSKNSFSDKVNSIIAENLERIKKFPPINFHSSSDVEIRHAYGAMNSIDTLYLPAMRLINIEKSVKDILMQYEEQCRYLAEKRGQGYSKRIESHINVLMRRDVTEIEIEKDRNDYLKECAFLLHEIIDLCDRAIGLRDPEWENPLRFDKLFISDDCKKNILARFSGSTGYGVILGLKEYCGDIVESFRLTVFRKS